MVWPIFFDANNNKVDKDIVRNPQQLFDDIESHGYKWCNNKFDHLKGPECKEGFGWWRWGN